MLTKTPPKKGRQLQEAADTGRFKAGRHASGSHSAGGIFQRAYVHR